jgi:hypothetical protein
MVFGQRRDQAGNYAGLAYAAGMSADDDNCHSFTLVRRRQDAVATAAETAALLFPGQARQER